MEIFRIFTFESAHFLPNVPEEHKCRRLHGHTFRVELHVAGDVGGTSGWVMDFADLDTAFAPVRAEIDHQFLNAIPGLENPTSENLARWLWNRLKPTLPQLSRVIVQENCMSGCVYRGD